MKLISIIPVLLLLLSGCTRESSPVPTISDTINTNLLEEMSPTNVPEPTYTFNTVLTNADDFTNMLIYLIARYDIPDGWQIFSDGTNYCIGETNCGFRDSEEFSDCDDAAKKAWLTWAKFYFIEHLNQPDPASVIHKSKSWKPYQCP